MERGKGGIAYLETPDNLLAALLGNLVAQVLLGASAVLGGSLLGILLALANLLLGLVVKVLIEALRCLAMGSFLAGLSIGTRRGWVRRVGTRFGDILHVLLGVTFVHVGKRTLDVVLGQIGGLVPSVVISGFVNLAELIFGRLDLLGSIRGSVTSNIS